MATTVFDVLNDKLTESKRSSEEFLVSGGPKDYGKAYWANGGGRQSPEKKRAARIKSRYGITIEQYEGMAAKQGGKCAVCGEPPSDNNTRAHWNGKLCIDHCHDTGKVRGLLCNDCNLAVGYTKKAETAESIARYIRLHDRPDSGDNT